MNTIGVAEVLNVALNATQIGLVHAQKTIDSRVNHYAGSIIALNALTLGSNFVQACRSFGEEVVNWTFDNSGWKMAGKLAAVVATPILLGYGAIRLNRLYLPVTALKGGAVWTNTIYQHAMQMMTMMNLALNASLACLGKDRATKSIGAAFTAGHLYSSLSLAGQKTVESVVKRASDDGKTTLNFSLAFRADGAVNPTAIDKSGTRITVEKVVSRFKELIAKIDLSPSAYKTWNEYQTTYVSSFGVSIIGQPAVVTIPMQKLVTRSGYVFSHEPFKSMLSSYSEYFEW